MKKVITTVGTSLFENFEPFSNIENDYNAIKDAPFNDYNMYLIEINNLKSLFTEVYLQNNPNASAEITSIKKIFDVENNENDIEVYLLATDTILSALAANIIMENKISIFNNNEFTFRFYEIRGLQIGDNKIFQKEGLVTFVEIIEKIAAGYYENVILNITGGYKALIPYMTIFGQINNIKTYYIFENTDNLIQIPQVPLSINWELFEKYGPTLENLNIGITNWTQYKRESNIDQDFNIGIWEEGELAELNAIGKWLYNKYKTWALVYVLRGGPFSTNDAYRNRMILNKAISNLIYLINNFIINNQLTKASKDQIYTAIKNNGGDNLNHVKINDNCFVSKYPSANPEIRFLYNFEYNNHLTNIHIFDFRIGGFNHDTYINEFREFFLSNQNKSFIPYLTVNFME